MKWRLFAIVWLLFLAFPAWSDPQIFQDHNGVLHFYDGVNYQKSYDAGITWRPMPSPSGTVEVQGCQLFELNQVLYAARLENQRIVLSPSYSGGENWLKSKFLDLPWKPENFRLFINKDVMHLQYQKDGLVYYASSFDQGATFSPAKLLNDHYPSDIQAQLTVFKDQLLLFFTFRENNWVKFYLTRSLDNGKTWNLLEPLKEEWNQIEEMTLTNLTEDLLILFIDRTAQNIYELQAQAISDSQWSSPQKIFDSPQKFVSFEVQVGPDRALLLGFTQNSQFNLLRFQAGLSRAAIPEIFSGLAQDRFRSVTLRNTLAGQGILVDYFWPETYFQNLCANAPKLQIVKPKALEWLKSAATFYLEASITDLQNDLSEDSLLKVTVNKKACSHSLAYSPEDKLVSGFVSLPADLPAGKFDLMISLSDQAGNLGKISFQLQLDPAPPMLETSFKNGVALRNSGRLLVPLIDNDAGIDLQSSIIQVRKITSEEVKGSVMLESGQLYFVPQNPLTEGTYLLEVSARDLAGNVGAVQTVSVQINNFLGGRVSALSSNVLSLEYGPNPFNPLLDKDFVIKYQLAAAQGVKLYIFNLLSNLIYQCDLGAGLTNSFVWNGSDQFGSRVPAGVYPFALWVADITGKQEVKRGKIIVLN